MEAAQPGGELGTGGRVRMWAGSIDEDVYDDKMSDGEPAENSGRERWTKVELRRDDMAGKERYYGSIFPEVQSADGTNRFMRVQRVRTLGRHLNPIELSHFVTE